MRRSLSPIVRRELQNLEKDADSRKSAMKMRSISPIVRRELENLEKDADSRKSAMKTLKSYVKELDSKAIPLFLAQVSETNTEGGRKCASSAGEHAISLYEVLARFHGPKIVPQICNIMSTIIKSLASSAGSFPLHQACSKVVPAIARYAMDPTTPDEKKRYIINSLAKPLSDCLLGSHEYLSSGAALCLKALVESDNWRFASNEIVNEVCQCVAGALDKHGQTNSHMALVTSLAKHNSLTVEAYARILIRSGLNILKFMNGEGNSQRRLSAVHMINSLMRHLDPRSILSEVRMVIEEMEMCQSEDKMLYVRGAAFEALQTAKRIIHIEKGPSRTENDVDSVTGSNFDIQGYTKRKIMFGSGSNSPDSPESQTIDSFLGFNSSGDLSDGRRSVNRKLWRRRENGGVDVSLKDGIFSEATTGYSDIHNSESDMFSINGGDYRDGFEGFFPGIGRHRSVKSATPSPQRSRSYITPDNVAIFTTPRKLIQSLQDAQYSSSQDSPEKQSRRHKSLSACEFEWSPAEYIESCHLDVVKAENNNGDEKLVSLFNKEPQNQNSESVSSSAEDVSPEPEYESFTKVDDDQEGKEKPKADSCAPKLHQHFVRATICSLLIVLLAVFGLLWNNEQDQGYNLVPT
ncbi:unnamed protein product [Cuscuta epithymum]|uniref:TORTIFOLIA1/SINE1-2 N-terminal domain-containing protein n=1 Tax=Cuscuta epithymum TaxID=186058 RepID=A0AAV0C7Q7_9ASTE|nr:unnamed protein product [Cuscuta epithymum]